MHFRAVASMAALACVASASASFGSFYMASPASMGLVRRVIDGYQPNSTLCDRPGNTCAQVCGSDYAQCASTSPDETHCFKPTAGESCCMDGSGSMFSPARYRVPLLTPPGG